MKERIQKLMKNIEETHKVKVLFAIENGSRAWRIESKDSDYDVRFVFVRRNGEDYISLEKQKEVIEIMVGRDEHGIETIDAVGFDIHKFMRLLSDSNPTVMEWLQSDIVWYGQQPVDLSNWARLEFNPRKLFMHYRSLVKDNYKKYIENGTDVTYKRYLCVFRAMVNANWIMCLKRLPPISFNDALKDLDFVSEPIENKIKAMIKDKKNGVEVTQIKRIPEFDKLIYNFAILNKYSIEEKPFKDLEFFNKKLREIIYLGGFE